MVNDTRPSYYNGKPITWDDHMGGDECPCPSCRVEHIVIDAWNRCSECKMLLSETMHYVCPHPKCPCGLGGPQCSILFGQ